MAKHLPPDAMSKMEQAKNVKDEDKLYKYEGVVYSSIMSPPENLKCLKNLEARPEDTFLVAYPKCGFNWTITVLHKIMAAASGKEIERPKMPPLIEFLSPEMQQAVAAQPSPRVLGTHLHPDNIPASFTANKTKTLVVFRNPKDTVVSYYHFMNKNPVLPNVTWDSFFTDFMTGEVGWGSYFDHALAWDKRMDDPNVMIVTFEQLKENLGDGVQQISKFFGFPLTEEQIQTIAGESSFNAMKESSQNTHGQHGSVFFRKGEVGDWKNHFTDAQSKQMDEEFQKQLAGTKLGAKLKYDVYCM